MLLRIYTVMQVWSISLNGLKLKCQMTYYTSIINKSCLFFSLCRQNTTCKLNTGEVWCKGKRAGQEESPGKPKLGTLILGTEGSLARAGSMLLHFCGVCSLQIGGRNLQKCITSPGE